MNWNLKIVKMKSRFRHFRKIQQEVKSLNREVRALLDEYEERLLEDVKMKRSYSL